MSTVRRTSRCSANGRARSTASPSTSRTSTGSTDRSRWPDSIRAMSRTSSIRFKQVLPGPQDVTDSLFLLVRQIVHVEQLGEAQHRVERRPQLVAHPRQKLALGQAGPLGHPDGREELRLEDEVLGDVS